MKANIILNGETIAQLFCRDAEHGRKKALVLYGPGACINDLEAICLNCGEWFPPEILNCHVCQACMEAGSNFSAARLIADLTIIAARQALANAAYDAAQARGPEAAFDAYLSMVKEVTWAIG